MNKISTILLCLTFSFVQAQNVAVFKKDFTKPEATEVWSPKPRIITPGLGPAPPSDAIVLFSGKNMDNWVIFYPNSSRE